MPSQEFNTSWKRIERAEAHRNEIAKTWNEFCDLEDAYRPTVDVEDDGTGSISVYSPYGDGPLRSAALQIGEMLYQFRSALDACIYSAAILETGQDPPPGKNALEFPICIIPGDFDKAAWKIEPLTDQRRNIVEGIQPYNAPKDLTDRYLVFNYNRALAILNDWARIDRHRRLHIVSTWVVGSAPQLQISGGALLDSLIVHGSNFLEGDCEIASFTLKGWKPNTGMKISVNPHLSLEIGINEHPFPCHVNDSLATRCEAIRRAVTTVVLLFEESFGLAKPSEDI